MMYIQNCVSPFNSHIVSFTGHLLVVQMYNSIKNYRILSMLLKKFLDVVIEFLDINKRVTDDRFFMSDGRHDYSVPLLFIGNPIKHSNPGRNLVSLKGTVIPNFGLIMNDPLKKSLY